MKYKIWIRLIAVVTFILVGYFFNDVIRMPFDCMERFGPFECPFRKIFSVVFWALIGSFGLFFITTNFAFKHKWLGIIIYLPAIIAFPMSMGITDSGVIVVLSFLLSLAIPIYFLFSKNQVSQK